MGTTVLLVDDHPIFRKGLRQLLEEEADLHVVGEAGAGQAAIDLARQLEPDVVVMDITMPGLNGIEATQRILGEAPHAHVMALSIHSEKRFIEDMLRAGAAGYILKDSVPEELVAGIRAVARGAVYLSAAVAGIVVSDYVDVLSHARVDEEIRPEPLRRTKLYRPPLTLDLVPRPRLLERLNRRRQRPLTLVCASAGYGKTTLASSWLQSLAQENPPVPGAWLSLDEEDNDLAQFTQYLLAAVRTLYPDACPDTLAMLRAATLPPLPVLARSLSNELDALKPPFVLALDDYHLIHDPAVHELLDELLARPPRPLHLALITRVDPPIDLLRLRAHNRVTEIRTADLRFTEDETAAFLRQELGGATMERAVDDRAVTDLLKRVQGWAVGLRLVALWLRQRGRADLSSDRLQGSVSSVTDYLATEVLEAQPRAIQDTLLRTAILSRFCAPLCQAVAFGLGESPSSLRGTAMAGTDQPELDGQAFLRSLARDNLFVVPLDDEGTWYRYHPLFQELLQDRLAQRQSAEEIAGLHRRASAWYAHQGLVEEALRHALEAGESRAAAELVIAHRHAVMNQERWDRLERWLKLLPREAIAGNADLLLARAWVLDNKFRLDKIPPLLEQAQAQLDRQDAALTAREQSILEAEMAALRGNLFAWVGQGQLALDSSQLAVEVTPLEHAWVRGIALNARAVAYQLVGQLDRAYQELHTTLSSSSGTGGASVGRTYVGYLAVNVLAGNLRGAERAALRILDLAHTPGLDDARGWALYTRGHVTYQRSELAEASQSFSQLIDMRYLASAGAAAQGYYGLALCHQALGRPDEAQGTIQAALDWASETGNAGLAIDARALASRLELLQGRVPDAKPWAGLLGDALPLLMLLHIPHLVLPAVLLAQGTPEALREARDLLARLHHFAETTHTTSRLIEIVAMQALLEDAEGRPEAALDLLREAVEWGVPRGYIRLFVDMGHKMAGLLEGLRERGVADDIIDPILAAFRTTDDRPQTTTEPVSFDDRPSSVVVGQDVRRSSSPPIDPLTDRELEVLALLAQRLSNKEIATCLVISAATVRTHTYNLYQKLNVKGRRQAVRKAIELGILDKQRDQT